jgi:hypothetical protein
MRKSLIVLALLLISLLFFYNFKNNEIPQQTITDLATEPSGEKSNENIETQSNESQEQKESLDVLEDTKKTANKENEPKTMTKEILVKTNDILRTQNPAARGAAKSYKEVTVLELEGDQAFKIVLDEALENVGSVVLVSLDGPILIKEFSANDGDKKTFSKDQESMKGDWVKLDGPREALQTVDLKTYSKTSNRLKVYVQHFSDEVR